MSAATDYDSRPWLSSYPPDVPADFAFPLVPLTRLLDDAAAGFPAAVAISAAGETLSYRELRDHVDRLAGGLSALGVTAGDRVALILPNCPQHVIAFFAVLRLGATVVQCNPLATADELRGQLGDCTPAAVVCLDKSLETVQAVRQAAGIRAVVVTTLVDYRSGWERRRLSLPLPGARADRRRLLGTVPKDADVVWFRPLLRRSNPARQVAVDAARDVAVLQYTGGTTGTSKAAMLSHANLVANAYQMRLWLPEATSGREVTLTVLPLFHVYGLTLCLLTTVLLAGRLALLPNFDVDLLFDAIESEAPTLLPGVPPIYQAMVDALRVQRTDLSSIRACVSGAMRLPVDVQERFERLSGGRLVEGYGTTEASPATHCNPIQGIRKAGSVGVPLTGTLARIVDPDDPARVLPAGETGELVVKGPQVFLGYWGRDAAEQVLLADGWLLTGDLAMMDEDGFFSIVDRKKDLVIAGGFNVYPTEVEAVVVSHPGVAECCVVGLPDRYRGETVKAYVVVTPGVTLTEAEVREHCAAHLSAYKVPKIVEFRDDLPRTAIGKALRRLLVAEELAKLEGGTP
ncbi:MAG: long-chain acyl-CoA synthetase [Frankiaceae bacterium]|nr:long-chain acyl-CoA synthetase [Frankiaceae bacterium]